MPIGRSPLVCALSAAVIAADALCSLSGFASAQTHQPVVQAVRHRAQQEGVQSPPLGGPRRSTPAPPLPGSRLSPPMRVDVPGPTVPAVPRIPSETSPLLIPGPVRPRRPGETDRLPPLEPELVTPPLGPNVWTLETLSDLALSANPSIGEAWAQVRSARGAAIQAGLYPNPTFNVSSPQLAGSDSQWNSFLTQEFVTKGKLRISRAAAMRGVQQAELQYARRRFDVLTSLRAQFYTTLAAQERVEVLRNLLSIADASWKSAEKLERVGEGTRSDTLLLQIEQGKSRLALENGETMLRAAYQQLAATAGMPELAISAVTADITAGLPDFEYEALRQGVVTQNALAQVAQLEVSRSRILLQRAIVEPFPNVVAMGGYQRQIGEIPVPNQGLFQVTLPVPLWNRNQGNIAAAQANVTAAARQYDRVQNELSLRAAAALAEYRTSVQRVERHEKEILPQARELLRVAQQGYAAGQFDFFRLLAAQRTLLETNLTYVNAQETRWLAAAQIAGLLQVEQFP